MCRSLVGVWAVLFLACDPQVVTRTLHRTNCVVCHQPLAENDPLETDGAMPIAPPHRGIEDAHPWRPLTCVDCHGGTARICSSGAVGGTVEAPTCDGDWVYDKDLAHVDPGNNPRDLDALTAGDLDRVDEAWIRFQNPSDLRVVNLTCGRCHIDEAAALRRSGHALQTGDLAIARLRSGQQPDVIPRFGATAQRDPNPPDDGCTTSSVTRFSPLLIDTTTDPATSPRTAPTPANVQEQLLAQICIGCHVQDAGPVREGHDAAALGPATRAPGTHRGAGCSACHNDYAEDGLSASDDPFVSHSSPTHPETHALVASPSTRSCVACHSGGARIGLSFQGFREVTPAAADTHAVPVGRALYGLPVGALLRDEDDRNGFDETPPDVHFEAGMDCVDCHGAAEVHGTGHIGGDQTCETGGTRCEDCHGDVRRAADLRLTRHALTRRADGAIILTTRRSGRELVVPQTRDALDPRSPHHNPEAVRAKGVSDDDWSHADAIECSTCHAGWMPSCYGCHVELDLAGTGRYLTTAAIVPGKITTTLLHSAANDQVVVWNSRGKLQGSMPAERLFTSLFIAAPGGSTPAFTMVPRAMPTAEGHRLAFGQRPIDPHTTRRTSRFAACDRCHATLPDGTGVPANQPLLDLTYGFGTHRFDVLACALEASPEAGECGPDATRTPYALDALMARDGTPLVLIGHANVRPLSLEEVDRLRRIEVPATTPIPPDAMTNRSWPAP